LGRHAGSREQAAGGEEFGVEQGGTGGTAQQVVREQRELYVEERTFANAAHGGGHAVASVDVAARLRAIFFVEDNDRIFQSGRKRREFVTDGEVAQDFADFSERGNFLKAHRDRF